MVGDSNSEANFPYKLLLINKQVSSLCKTFENGLSGKLKFPKTNLSKMIQLKRFLLPYTGPYVSLLQIQYQFHMQKNKRI